MVWFFSASDSFKENKFNSILHLRRIVISSFQIIAEMSETTEKTDESLLASKSGIGDVVASHYNNLQERGKAARTESR
jgi:hypothetical protein